MRTTLLLPKIDDVAKLRREAPCPPADVLRFTASERVLHWVNAIPYLVLSASGALLLLQRMGIVQWLSAEAVGLVHRVAGFTLVGAVFLAIWGGSWRRLARLFKDFFTITANDVRWGWTSFLRVLGFDVASPPVGRFNLGQKVNAIVQVLSINGLAVTGMLMIFVPGLLAAWRLHLAFFFFSTPLVLVHLYMSLIHPGTRPALRGMITGRVSREWARHHHGAWLAEQDERWERCMQCADGEEFTHLR